MTRHTKYQGSRASGFKLFTSKIYFSLCDLDMQRTRTIRTILVEGRLRIICVKLFQNWTRGVGGVFIKSIVNRGTDD